LRAYEIVPVIDFSKPIPPNFDFNEAFNPSKQQDLRVWDLTLGSHEADPSIEQFYEKTKPDIAIMFHQPWNEDRVSKFQRRNKIQEPHVYTLDAKSVYLVSGNVTPRLIKEELDPNNLDNKVADDRIVMRLGQFPFSTKNDLTSQMLARAKINIHQHVPFTPYTAAAEHDWHSLQDERVLRKYCGAYQCPVCKPLEHFENHLHQLEEEGVLPKDERCFFIGQPAWKYGRGGMVAEFPPKEGKVMTASASVVSGVCNCIYCTRR